MAAPEVLDKSVAGADHSSTQACHAPIPSTQQRRFGTVQASIVLASVSICDTSASICARVRVAFIDAWAAIFVPSNASTWGCRTGHPLR